MTAGHSLQEESAAFFLCYLTILVIFKQIFKSSSGSYALRDGQFLPDVI